jgi:hypothetical protein
MPWSRDRGIFIGRLSDFVGAWLARDGGLTADLYFVGRVHIHFCGNGCLGFRPYGDSLFFQTPKQSKQKKARP